MTFLPPKFWISLLLTKERKESILQVKLHTNLNFIKIFIRWLFICLFKLCAGLSSLTESLCSLSTNRPKFGGDFKKFYYLMQLFAFVCFLTLWTGVSPITEYSCDKPVPVFLSAMAKKQTPPIDRPWCYHTGASLNGKPDWKPPISMHVLYWPFHKVKGRKNLFPIPCFRVSQHRD